MKRTLTSQTVDSIGKTVKIMGWVNTRRDHGKIIFLDIRDRSGIIQVVTNSQTQANSEHVVEIVGQVKERPDHLINPNIPTGQIEIEADSLTILNKSLTPPFPLDSEGLEIGEETRLKYRYLDLRRPRMARNIRLRSQAAKFIRDWLVKEDFVEIDTPILTRSTPEGARDFLVPSRLQPGNFYALPQSPQQYKQLLMVAGFERYFQLAHCFRDEDPRVDRSYGEFIQLDMEMSFVQQEDILQLTENLFTQLVETIFPEKTIARKPWPRLSHKDALEKYGTDRPDLRRDKNNPNELAFAWTIDFPLFENQKDDDFFHGSGSAKFAPSHHMFTAPHPDDIDLLKTDPTKTRGLQHDMVLNGHEVGGGSIRIHDPKIQQQIFDLIGFSEDQKQMFSHMLNAFEYGVPPHGGIAPGFDRFLYVVLGEPNIREITPFPNNSSGQVAVMNAPSAVSAEQLAELGINLASKTTDPSLSVFDQIIQKLDSLNIKYHILEHEPVITSQQASKIRGTSLAQGAKALIMIADKNPIMIVLSGATKADTKKLKQLLNIKDLRMANPQQVEQISKVKIGAVPPFGSILGLKTIVDKKLSKNKHVSFNAGLQDRSIKITYQDFIRAEQPQVESFSK